MDIIYFINSILLSPLAWFAVFLFFLLGYTWVAKENNVDDADADHINKLQDEKLDSDGEIPCVGTMQWDKGADIASAATLAPGDDGNYFDVTGTTTITAINATMSQPGTVIKLHFDGILKLVHHATNLILPDGKDIYTLAGLELEFVEYDTNKWRCTGHLRGIPVLSNILTNSGFGVWSQSDTNKGLGTLNYDNLAVSTFQVGEAITTAAPPGGSGATGKVITDDGSTLVLGACAGRFNDNEQITGADSAATADVDMPDTAPGVDLMRNSDQWVGAAAAVPPNGWIVGDPGVFTIFDSGDGVPYDKCLKIEVNANPDANPWVYQSITTVVGKIYTFRFYFKHGDANGGNVYLGTSAGDDTYASWLAMTDAAWAEYSLTFEATTATTFVSLQTASGVAAEYELFDEISCYEITPCCTGADKKALDGWTKSTTLDIYREHQGSNTKSGSFYALKAVPTSADVYISWPHGGKSIKEEFHRQFDSRTACAGVWVKTSTASHVELYFHEDGWIATGIEHSGSGNYEWLEFPNTFGSASTELIPFTLKFKVTPNVDGSTIVYVSQPMLVFGSSIGEGNYRPRQQEVIMCEVAIDSNEYHALTMPGAQSGGWIDLNLEADSDGKIPKGCRAIYVFTAMSDSGSAGSNPRIYLRKDAIGNIQYSNTVEAWANNATNRTTGRQECGYDGDVDIYWVASGAGALNFGHFRYNAIQVN